MGQRSRRERNWSTVENVTDPIPQSRVCQLKEHESRGKESPSKTSNNSDPLLDAQVGTQTKTTKRAHAHSDRGRERIEECLRTATQGAERLDRRSEVINEALADEIQRGKVSRGRREAAELQQQHQHQNLAASTSHESSENPIEPDPNPKETFIHEVSFASSQRQWQQRVKRSATDAELEARMRVAMEMCSDESAALPSALAANTRRRIAENSAPVAVTTQEGIDGYREQAKMIASVEQVELGNIMELSNHGPCAQMGKTIEALVVTIAAKKRMDRT